MNGRTSPFATLLALLKDQSLRLDTLDDPVNRVGGKPKGVGQFDLTRRRPAPDQL
jgi:hypothetical protein